MTIKEDTTVEKHHWEKCLRAHSHPRARFTGNLGFCWSYLVGWFILARENADVVTVPVPQRPRIGIMHGTSYVDMFTRRRWAEMARIERVRKNRWAMADELHGVDFNPFQVSARLSMYFILNAIVPGS